MRLLLLAAVLPLAACASDPTPTEAGEFDGVAASAPADTAEAVTGGGDGLATESPEPTERADWSGEPAVRPDGLRFVSDPTIRPALVEAFSVEPGLLERLEGDAALYDTDRVTTVGEMLAVSYQPTAANPDQRPLYLLIHRETGHAHAVLTDGGDTFYRRSYAASASDLSAEAVSWMRAQSGVDVAEQARLGDEEVPSP